MLTPSTTKPAIKAAAKKLLPAVAYSRTAALWHLRGRSVWLFSNLFRHGRPEVLLHFGIAPGDDLLCTVVLRELSKRGVKSLWMMSNYPELFQGNQDVERVVPVDFNFERYVSFLGARSEFLAYAPYDEQNDISIPPSRHIIAELCWRTGIRGEVVLRPYFRLRDDERAACCWSKDMIAIQSSGLSSKYPMRNKQWFPERFQEVVNRLKHKFNCFQIGSAEDPLLDDVTDLRGKTSIRVTAALLANCRLYVGNVGFLMHLARAVECPSVIVYGGREAPWQSGYSCNANLYSAMKCSPCWAWNTCDYDRLCMKDIGHADVIRSIYQTVDRPRACLTEDSYDLLC